MVNDIIHNIFVQYSCIERLGNLFSSILESHAKVWYGTFYTTLANRT